MDLQEIGSLFMVGFHGTQFDGEIRELLDALNPCGVILFSRNVVSPVQVAQLNHEVQQHCLDRTGHGLLIGVDQEGGRVRRLPEPFSVFPAALELAFSADPDAAVRNFAEVTARELLLAGFNLDFAPVLDVVERPNDVRGSVIGDRSYGADAEMVSRLGLLVMDTMRSLGVIACGKHFPGHGGTLVDSHRELPVDDRPREVLETRDLVPFTRAAEKNADMIMTAHVLYTALDEDRPATLSESLLRRLLRERMGFTGVVITDDLDMGAVAHHHSPAESAVMAIKAGADIPLFCNDPSKAFAARSGIAKAIADGEISEDRIHESLRRIRTLKTRYAASLKPCDVAAVRGRFRGQQ
jgi:beta-N-acetylhexosaminidase